MERIHRHGLGQRREDRPADIDGRDGIEETADQQETPAMNSPVVMNPMPQDETPDRMTSGIL